MNRRRLILLGLGGLVLLLAAAAWAFREDIWLTGLDPKTPHQTYRPPAAPDYADPAAWALYPTGPAQGRADVFFVHPTTYDGGGGWNGAVDDPEAGRILQEVMLPNYAGPFARLGRVFAPRYRQASLYATLRTREDAREARAFAYEDVRRAFRTWKARHDTGRPLILVGVEQGGLMADRLLREEVAADPALLSRLAAAYLIETKVPAEAHTPADPVPACGRRAQARCVAAYAKAAAFDEGRVGRRLDSALVWTARGDLVPMEGRAPLCVNPVSGAAGETPTERREHLGAAAATGLEWGARPGFLAREVEARCDDGLLHVSRPKSPSLKAPQALAARQRVAPYNLFWADLEADAQARMRALTGYADAPPIDRVIEVRERPIRTID